MSEMQMSGAFVQIYPRLFMRDVAAMSAAERGHLITQVFDALEAGDRSFFEMGPSFIGRVSFPSVGRPHIPVAIRREVYAKANYKCVACGSPDQLSIDHIVPRSKGGPDHITNYRTLCLDCNRRKGARCDG